MAVNTDKGLFAPVIKQADLKSLEEIDEEMTQNWAIWQKGQVSPGDMEDGTFTISNAGRFGSPLFCTRFSIDLKAPFWASARLPNDR